jgi:GTP-binding protein
VGAVVATEPGKATAYALFHVQERTTLFITPGTPVYEGQIVGENRRGEDMNANVCKAKKLSNVRAAGKDENTVVSPPRELTIERALEWIEEDELLEVTPLSLRLRKRELSQSRRKR